MILRQTTSVYAAIAMAVVVTSGFGIAGCDNRSPPPVEAKSMRDGSATMYAEQDARNMPAEAPAAADRSAWASDALVWRSADSDYVGMTLISKDGSRMKNINRTKTSDNERIDP